MKKETKNILCSVSAGYSSVMMAIKIREWYPDHNIINVMANTSKERQESLEFMNQCDQYYGLNLIWLETEFLESGKGVKPIVKKYEDLSTNGEVFEKGIQKLGIPSSINKWCNRDLKKRVIIKYTDTVFGKGNYSIAIGIRADEIDRVTKSYKSNNIFYPLIDNGLTKQDRNKFWDQQPIKIKIPAYKGNCDLCFEKSKRKLLTIIKEDPETVNWWKEMYDRYGSMPKQSSQSYTDELTKYGKVTFFRKRMTIDDMVEEAKTSFALATDEYVYENDLFDQEGDCGSGCVVF